MDFGLKGRVVMVTGGASGIGRAVVEAALRDGAKVVVADINAAPAQAFADEINKAGGAALALAYDVCDQVAAKAGVAKAIVHFGRIDGLVTSAGISTPQVSEHMTAENWSNVLQTNVSGTFYTAQEVGRQMIKQKSGSIITIASIDGLGGHAGRVNYCSSKFAVIGLTKTLAIEWGRYGVRVNALAPGAVDTARLRANIPDDYVRGVMEDRTPLGRLSRAEEQANVCMFLLSDAASYVTGTVLTADGGLTAGSFTAQFGADYGSRALTEAAQ